MKAEELRIGNLVLFSDRIMTIDEINSDGSVEFEDSLNKRRLVGIQPIPLTEEILLKYGFEYHHDTPHPNRVFRKYHSEGIFDLEEIISFFYGGNFISVDVKYLHQLQNLYFALTGEELKVNL